MSKPLRGIDDCGRPKDARPAAKLRWFEEQDMRALCELYHDCSPDEEWTPEDISKFMHSGRSDGRINVLKVLTIQHDSDAWGDQVVGSLLYSLEGDTCRVRRICVHRDWRRQGLGQYMLDQLIGPQSVVRKARFTARVDLRRWQAACLFKKAGFACAAQLVRREGREFWQFSLTRSKTKRKVMAGIE